MGFFNKRVCMGKLVKMGSASELEKIISVDIRNTFNFYTIYPRIQIVRPNPQLVEKLRFHKVVEDRVAIGIRDLEFVKRLNTDVTVLMKENERVKKLVLKKMLEQNDADTLYLQKSRGRWEKHEFQEIQDNFLIEMKVSQEEIDFMRGMGVPERDMLTCLRVTTRKTKTDHSTRATCVLWYDCWEELLEEDLIQCEGGVSLKDAEWLMQNAESGNCQLACISPRSKKGLQYLRQRVC